jgi:hypothetical protein
MPFWDLSRSPTATQYGFHWSVHLGWWVIFFPRFKAKFNVRVGGQPIISIVTKRTEMRNMPPPGFLAFDEIRLPTDPMRQLDNE